MSEYIRREDALDAFGEEYVPRTDFERGMVSQMSCDKEKIKALPSADVVQVVRCKDCKFRENDDFCTGRGFPYQLVPDDGFCDKGERKE